MEDVISWARELGLVMIPPERDDLIHLADGYVGYSIGERQDLFAVEFSTREHDRELLGAFDDIEDARRFLVMEFGVLHRGRSSMPPLRATEPPAGYVLEETPTALWLSWMTGSAEFPADYFSRRRAVTFARVERADVEQIRESYREPAGRPLFGQAA